MKRSLLLSIAIVCYWASPASAQVYPDRDVDPVELRRPGDMWTAGGLLWAPRFMKPGSFEFGLGPGFVIDSAPKSPGAPVGSVLGVQGALADGLELISFIGPVSLTGLRGRLVENEFGAVSIGLVYRSDSYATGTPQPAPGAVTAPASLHTGLAEPFFGALPISSVAVARGGELRVSAMERLGIVNVFGEPRLTVLSNGTRLGLGLAVDLDLDRFVVGLSWAGSYNLSPAPGVNTVFENQYSFGGRFIVNDSLYAAGTLIQSPADAYGTRSQAVLGGIGYRK